MQRTGRALVEEIKAGEPFDFISGFSGRYAATILTHVTGTEGSQTAQDLLHWLELSEVLTLNRPSDAHIAALENAQVKQRNCFRAVINDRRSNPRDDLVTELLNAEIDGVVLTDGMIISLLELLLGAGFDTVSYTLCHCAILFARRPDLMDSLRQSPDLIPAFIEEMMRFDPPTHYLLRQTTADVILDEITIPKDSLALLMVGSANRDRHQFQDPDSFLLDRSNIREHLAFGAGPHACIGAALARLETKIALEALLSEFSKVHCPNDEDLPWISSMNVHAPNKLPTTFYK
jgi:cytochrome P450